MLTESKINGTGAFPASGVKPMKARIVLVVAALAAGGVSAALAQQATNNVATFESWNVFVGNDQSGKVCFIASHPSDSKYSQAIASRGTTVFQITSAPASGVRNEPSTIVGFTIATSADVTVDIDGTKFRMFLDPSYPDTAWAVPEQQQQLVDAMVKGSKMTVSATSSPRGTVVTDNYSLRGVTAAMKRASDECS